MIEHFTGNETRNIDRPSIEKFDDKNAKEKMTFKEAESYWKDRFKNEAEQAKSETGKSSEEKINNSDAEIQDIRDTVRDYIKDLKDKSEFSDTISEDAIDPSKLELRSPEEIVNKREEFENKKTELRKEWEKQNNRGWPTYKEDVVNSNGMVIRKAGDRYDIHHIQPLKLGGENVVSNITPLDYNSHKDIHSSSGSCKALVDKF